MKTLNVTRLAEWGAVLTFVITGTLWLGSLNARVEAGEGQLKDVAEQVKSTPTQVAVLQTQMAAVNDTVKEIKDRQKDQDTKLDRILEQVKK